MRADKKTARDKQTGLSRQKDASKTLEDQVSHEASDSIKEQMIFNASLLLHNRIGAIMETVEQSFVPKLAEPFYMCLNL